MNNEIQSWQMMSKHGDKWIHSWKIMSKHSDKWTMKCKVGKWLVNMVISEYIVSKLETIFPQDMIHDIYNLHWNIIPKLIGVTWNVFPYKLIRLPGHPNLNLNLT